MNLSLTQLSKEDMDLLIAKSKPGMAACNAADQAANVLLMTFHLLLTATRKDLYDE